jgi:prophage DNA circulation protein
MSHTIKRIPTGTDEQAVFAVYPSQAISLNKKFEVFRGSRGECHAFVKVAKGEVPTFLKGLEKVKKEAEAAENEAKIKAAEKAAKK